VTRLTNFAGRLKQLGWAGAFLAILAALLFPEIVLSEQSGHTITIFEQAALVAAATVAVQLLRRRPLGEVTGQPGPRWLGELVAGCAGGAALMLLPALFLLAGRWVSFELGEAGLLTVGRAALAMAGVALAEELLFRGVLFQRLVAAFGAWPAQLAIAGLFVLTHMGNPGMEGTTMVWAGLNIFVASLVFGAAYLRTRSLALPIGLHFMANTMQGIVLGFGVSGEGQPSLLVPRILAGPEWLTGGPFGFEASLPGLVALLAIAGLVVRSDRPAVTRQAA
jgi:membrane protease YdiL (CAAX protease family)